MICLGGLHCRDVVVHDGEGGVISGLVWLRNVPQVGKGGLVDECRFVLDSAWSVSGLNTHSALFYSDYICLDRSAEQAEWDLKRVASHWWSGSELRSCFLLHPASPPS